MRRIRVDDYLSVIDRLCVTAVDELARPSQIAKTLGISTGYVSTTLLRLAEDGLVIHQPHAGAKLTELGRVRLRRFVHRLRITELLLEALLNWDQESVAAEAHQLEPAISDSLLETFDSYLGFPRVDRHAQKIVRPDGALPTLSSPPI
ncbi:MAG: metal-dependent transcriptional regulator [Planctomycetota bacterium]